MRTMLVTGGAGFIGSHIAEALVQRGDRVRVLDNLSTGHLANLERFRDRIEFIEGDLLDARPCTGAVAGVDCIFHEAALASVPRSVERPLDTHAACVTGTLNLLDAARRAGVRRVVYAALQQRLRRPADQQQARDRPARADLALRRGQAGRRVLLPGLHRDLRPRDRRAPLLQRLRPAAGPRQPLLGRDPAVHHGHALRQAADDLRRRAAVARFHLRGQRGACQPAGGRRPAASPAGCSTWPTAASTNLLELIDVLNRLLGTQVEPRHDPPRAGRRPREPGRHHPGPHAAGLRAAGRFRRGPAPLDRLLPAVGEAMRIRQALAVLGILAAAGTLAAPARAAVVIVANDTAAQVAFIIIQPDGKQSRHSLAAGDLMPIPATADINLAFEAVGRPCRYLLHPNSLHHFVTHEKGSTSGPCRPCPSLAAAGACRRGRPRRRMRCVPSP